MEQVNRETSSKKKSDLRDKIEETAIHSGIYRENINVVSRNGASDRSRSSFVREGLDTRHIEESRTIVNYSSVKPSKVNSTHENLLWEKFGGQSSSNRNVSRGRTVTAHNRENYDNDQQQLDGNNDFGYINHAPFQKTNGENNWHNVDYGDMDKGETAGYQELVSMYRNM